MKKFWSIVLMLVLSMTLAFGLTACGEDGSTESTDSQADSSETASVNDSGSVFPTALKDVQACEMPDVELTAWELSGGMVNGVEMEQEDLDTVLTACGGTFMFLFSSDQKLQMANGEQTFDGTYEVVEDGYAIHATFTGYEYYGVFSKVQDMTVLIIANVKDSETALYLTEIAG